MSDLINAIEKDVVIVTHLATASIGSIPGLEEWTQEQIEAIATVRSLPKLLRSLHDSHLSWKDLEELGPALERLKNDPEFKTFLEQANEASAANKLA